MTTRFISRCSAVMVALIFAFASVFALDLPVKTVKGKQYYYYKVRKNETIYGVSKRLGMTRDEIVRHNPSASDGIHKGMMLFFPVEDVAVEIPDVDVIPECPETEPGGGDTVLAIEPRRPAIALLLPLGSSAKEPSRREKLNLDFYKGLLVAADTLAYRSGKVDIYAFDTGDDAATLARLLDDEAVASAAVIIGPDDEASLETIRRAAVPRGTYVFNVMNFRDTAYIHTPYAIQANIPQREMYAAAVDGLFDEYPGYRPVILRNTEGRNDKESFVAYLEERCDSAGIEPVKIDYSGSLTLADLAGLSRGAGERYVMVPSSGTLAEFHKFAYVLKAFRDKVHAENQAESSDASASEVAVFGYPDWTAFRGDALDTLHKLEVSVYSRFFDDFTGFEARSFNATFKHWFGEVPVESIPSQGFLGYDTGCFLIKNLRINDGVFNPVNPARYSGIQSTFELVPAGEGYLNKALYLIKYNANGRMSARVI